MSFNITKKRFAQPLGCIELNKRCTHIFYSFIKVHTFSFSKIGSAETLRKQKPVIYVQMSIKGQHYN